MDQNGTYDYIVVGAGSAGAIVATRLTENPAVNVLLLEAGPEDRNIWSKIPLGFAKILFNPRYMWAQETEPEPELKDRRIGLPHGKLIGGSSAINGLVYVRGDAFDYDNWAAQGATGWAFKDVLPNFKKHETWIGGADDFHGGDGPIHAENARWKNPLAEAFIAAAQATLELPRNDDFNGPTRAGAGYWPLNTRRGRRSSTSEAYIKPHRHRPNLHIFTEVMVTRILFEGREAIGVAYKQGGQPQSAHASREVILCAGGLQTPQLLQVSGVGPASLLRQHGIEVVHDLPGVGENLMDHVQAGRVFSTTSRDTLNVRVGSVFAQMLAGLDYFVGPRTGPLTIGASMAGAYLYTRQGLPAPDVHLHFIPFTPGEKGWDLGKGSGFRLGMYPSRPESRGHVRITSPDMKVPPSVVFNHLSAENDVRILMDAMKLAARIAQAEPLQRMGVKELKPGPQGERDEGLLDWIRSTADTAFHYSGTARMGTDDMAVVDPMLKLRGIGRLRVIDASVMPSIVSGNTNAATLMIGEKGADLVKSG